MNKVLVSLVSGAAIGAATTVASIVIYNASKVAELIDDWWWLIQTMLIMLVQSIVVILVMWIIRKRDDEGRGRGIIRIRNRDSSPTPSARDNMQDRTPVPPPDFHRSFNRSNEFNQSCMLQTNGEERASQGRVKEPNIFTTNTDPERWFKRFKWYVEDHNINPKLYVKTLLSYLDDASFQLVESSIPSNLENLERIGMRFIGVFDNTSETITEKLAKYYNRKQKKGESPNQYASELTTLFNKAWGSDIDDPARDGSILQTYIDGLNDNIVKRAVQSKYPRTLEEAVREAKRVSAQISEPEEDRQNNQQNNYASNRNMVIRSCHNCGMPGHIARECRNKLDNNNNATSQLVSTPINSNFSGVNNNQQQASFQQGLNGSFIGETSIMSASGSYNQQPRYPNLVGSSSQTPTAQRVNSINDVHENAIIGRCELNGKVISFELDTGSPNTIISEEVWEQVKSIDSSIEHLQNKYVACNGSEINVLGRAKVRLRIGNYGEEVSVVIVKELKQQCLFGRDILEMWPETQQIIRKLTKIALFTTWHTPPSIKSEPSSPLNRDEFISYIKNEYSDIVANGLKDLHTNQLS